MLRDAPVPSRTAADIGVARPWTRADRLWLPALIVFVGLRLAFWLRGGLFVPFDDTLAQLHPWYSALFRSLRAGVWPAWSPELFLGYPLGASVEAHLFSPFNLPYLFLDPVTAFWVRFLLACCTAAVSAYLLARRFGCSPAAAAIAGVCFGLGNHVWTTVAEGYSLATLAWFPLVWLCWDGVLTGGRPLLWSLACGLTGGAALLGGHMQHAYNFGLLCAAWGVLRWWQCPVTRSRRRLAAVVVSASVAVGVFSVSLLPSLTIVADSSRVAFKPQDRGRDPIPLGNLPRLVYTPVRERDPDDNYVGLDFAAVGGLAVALAFLGGARLDHVLRGLAVAFLVMAMGSPPTMALVGVLPGYDFRDLHRCGLIWTLVISIAAACGTDVLRAAGPRRIGTAALLGRAGILFLLALVPVALRGGTRDLGPLEIGCAVVPMLLALAIRARLGTSQIASVLLTATLATGVVLATRGRASQQRDKGTTYEGHPTQLLSDLAAVPKSDEWGPTRLVVLPRFAYDGVNYVLLTGHQSPGGYATLTPYRLLRVLCAGRPLDPFSYENRHDFGFVSRPALLDLLNVRYLLASNEAILREFAASNGGQLPPVQVRDRHVVSIRSSYLPRSFYIARASFSPGEDAGFREITRPGFDPRERVVIEGPQAGANGDDSSAGKSRFTPAAVREYLPTRVTVEAEAPGPGWLVLLDRFDPDWRCRVNGIPTPIERADYLFRAVRVERGPVRAVFEYSNPRLRLGAWITGATLVLSLSALSLGVWRTAGRGGSREAADAGPCG